MSELSKHPGFLGFTSQGVILIHADWPMYPEEHGSDLALLWLTAFPRGTSFPRIDDIDRCTRQASILHVLGGGEDGILNGIVCK